MNPAIDFLTDCDLLQAAVELAEIQEETRIADLYDRIELDEIAAEYERGELPDEWVI